MSLGYYDYVKRVITQCEDVFVIGPLYLFVFVGSYELLIRWLLDLTISPLYVHAIVFGSIFTFGGAALISGIGLIVWLTLAYGLYRLSPIDMVTRQYGTSFYATFLVSRLILLFSE